MSRLLRLVVPDSAARSGQPARPTHKAHSSELDLNLAGGPNFRRPSGCVPSAGLDETDMDVELEAEAEGVEAEGVEVEGDGDGDVEAESQPQTPEPDVSGPIPTIPPVGQRERSDRGVGVGVWRPVKIGERERGNEGGAARDGEGAPGPHRRHTASQSQDDGDPLLHSYRGYYPGVGAGASQFASPPAPPDADAGAATTRPMHAFHTRPAPIAAPAPGTLLYSKGVIRRCL